MVTRGSPTKISVESQIVEIRSCVEWLEAKLPRRVEATDSFFSFKTSLYRASLIWRMAELSRGALENFEKGRLALAILETRAAIETSAALWFMHAKLASTVESRTLGNIDEFLSKLGWGSKADPDPHEAFNVLKFVDCVDKDYKGFRDQYEILSEYAHPNGAGTVSLFSSIDATNCWADFGGKTPDIDRSKWIGVTTLNVAVLSFMLSEKRFADIMPAFVALCDRHSTPNDAEKMRL
jgi:hypothetical protein